MSHSLDPELAAVGAEAARLGLMPVSADPAPPAEPPLTCFGHPLPAPFVWFCRHFPQHAGWPWGPETGCGILSPLGPVPSPLQRWNARRREDPHWPHKWISFSHTGDGDLCFSFEADGRAWVAYHDDHGNYDLADPEQVRLKYRDHFVATDFVDWFAHQVDWLLSRK